jgi:hypothetical protein
MANLNQEEIKMLITELLKNSVVDELGKIRQSRGYDGRLKPVSGSKMPAISNRKNTGFLSREINVQFETDLADGEVYLVIDYGLATYGEFVNDGRRGKLQGAKYPPLSAILTWARQRRLPQFRDERGRFMSNDDRAFLLQRSIGEYGIFRTNFVQKGVDNVIYYLGLYASEYLTNLLESKKIIVRTSTGNIPITISI